MSEASTARDQIAHSPLNTSTAKQQYSFSKGGRFRPLKKSHQYAIFNSIIGVTCSMTCHLQRPSERLRSAMGLVPTLPIECRVRLRTRTNYHQTSSWTEGKGRYLRLGLLGKHTPKYMFKLVPTPTTLSLDLAPITSVVYLDVMLASSPCGPIAPDSVALLYFNLRSASNAPQNSRSGYI